NAVTAVRRYPVSVEAEAAIFGKACRGRLQQTHTAKVALGGAITVRPGAVRRNSQGQQRGYKDRYLLLEGFTHCIGLPDCTGWRARRPCLRSIPWLPVTGRQGSRARR